MVGAGGAYTHSSQPDSFWTSTNFTDSPESLTTKNPDEASFEADDPTLTVVTVGPAWGEQVAAAVGNGDGETVRIGEACSGNVGVGDIRSELFALGAVTALMVLPLASRRRR